MQVCVFILVGLGLGIGWQHPGLPQMLHIAFGAAQQFFFVACFALHAFGCQHLAVIAQLHIEFGQWQHWDAGAGRCRQCAAAGRLGRSFAGLRHAGGVCQTCAQAG